MPQQPVEIILLRQWASYVTTPVWIMGPDGSLLYYNHAAEPVIGQPFDEAGEMSGEALADLFQTTAPDGSPLAADQLPINIALTERRPDHSLWFGFAPGLRADGDTVWRRLFAVSIRACS